MKPIIKWAGGKRKFAQQISDCIGEIEGCYYEPFVGSAALLLHLCPEHARCSDINSELINLYKVVKSNPMGLINKLQEEFVPFHSHDFFYQVRAWDRNKDEYFERTALERAARVLYLNKTCYNGIWRVNGKGENNVPIGRYVNPSILVPEDILSASSYFNENDVDFVLSDFRNAVQNAQRNDFVYFDPPYDVDEGQSSFLAYTQSLFNRAKQNELKAVCDDLINRGVRVGISNSNTGFIRNLYLSDNRYRITADFSVNRTIGGTIKSRRTFSEIFIIGE